MSIQNRSWFFQVTTDFTRFLQGDKPNQSTFENLLDSVPFKNVSSDKATTGAQGLIKIVSDANAKSNNDPDTTYSYGVQPHQLPTVTTSTQAINTNLTLTDFNDSVFTTTADGTATRNQYVINFKSTFITWLQSAFNELFASIGTLGTSITSILSSITTIQGNITTLQSNVANNTSDITDIQSDVADINTSLAAADFSLPIGIEVDYPSETPPNTKWKLANGQAIDRNTYATYFALIGTTYGVGDGATTFNIPDLRGRTTFMKNGTTEFLTVGQTGGVKTKALTQANMAKHTHSFSYEGDGSGSTIANGGTTQFTVKTGTTEDGTISGVGSGGFGGDGAAFSLLNPYMVRAKMIKVL